MKAMSNNLSYRQFDENVEGVCKPFHVQVYTFIHFIIMINNDFHHINCPILFISFATICKRKKSDK